MTQLDVIDLIVLSDGRVPLSAPPPWFTSVLSQEPVPEALQELGVIGYAQLPSMHPNSSYVRSRWVVVRTEGNEQRLVPELHLRAASQEVLQPRSMPYWIDEAKGVVGVATRAMTGEGARRQKMYGPPPGSAEYLKEWTEKNKERQRGISRRYAAKQREYAKIAKRLLPAAPTTVVEQVVKPVAVIPKEVQELARKLGIDASTLTLPSVGLTTVEEDCPRCGSTLNLESLCEWCGWPSAATRKVD